MTAGALTGGRAAPWYATTRATKAFFSLTKMSCGSSDESIPAAPQRLAPESLMELIVKSRKHLAAGHGP